MKRKTPNQPKQSKRAVQLKDIKPAKNPKGGESQTAAQRSRVTSLTVTFDSPVS